ncbi:MAG: type VII secretion protein EccB, partial [Angustibacter sp.]
MESKKEHVKAHNYAARRMRRSILTGRPDYWEPLYRRSVTGTTVGLALAILILVGFLIFGLLRPGKGPGLNPGTNLVIEKETGTRYLVQGEVLHPVANLASALLAVGPTLTIQTLSQKKTALLERGRPVGLVGAPEAVPKPSAVIKEGWSACIRGTTSTTGVVPPLEVDFGTSNQPGPLPGGDGLLVANPAGEVFLVADGVRHQITSSQARTAAGYASTAPFRVPNSWLATLTPGRALGVLEVSDIGEDGAEVAGRTRKIGQIVATRDEVAEVLYYLVRRDRVVPITRLESMMLLGNPRVADINPGMSPLVLAPGQSIGSTTREQLPESVGWPSGPPRLFTGKTSAICVASKTEDRPWVGVRGLRPVDVNEPDPVVVSVPPGSGLVAEAV